MSDMPMPKEAVVPLPLPKADTLVPVKYKPRHHQQPDEGIDMRDVMVRAAEVYDASQRSIESLKAQLNDAIVNLEVKNQHIAKLEADLAAERNRVNSYQAERDDAVSDRADLLAFFESFNDRIISISQALAHFDFPSRKRKHKTKSAMPSELGNTALGAALGLAAKEIGSSNGSGSDDVLQQQEATGRPD